MANLVELGLVPYWESMSGYSWTKFQQAFLGYKARGGDKPMRELISPGVQRLLKVRCKALDWAEGDDDAFSAAIGKLYAPKSQLEALAKFRAISMGDGKFTVDAAAAFCMEFSEMVERCEGVMPPEEMLVKEFLSKLRPAKFRDLVRMQGPKTMEECLDAALEQAEYLFSMLSQAEKPVKTAKLDARGGAAGPSESRTSNNSKSGSSATMTGEARGDKNGNGAKAKGKKAGIVRCYGCGEHGHIKPNCPSREKWDTRMIKKPQLKVVFQQDGQTGLSQSNASGVGAAGPNSNSADARRTDIRGSDSSHSDSSHSMDVPRHAVELLSAGCSKPVVALLDTGASVNAVGLEVYQQLLKSGVTVREISKKLVTAGKQPLEVTREVDVTVRVAEGVRKPVMARATCVVADCGEELLLSYAWLRENGLLNLLTHERDDCGVERIERESGGGDLDIEPSYQHILVEDEAFRGRVNSLVKENAELFGPIPADGADVPPFMVELLPGAALKPIPPRRLSPSMLSSLRAEVADLKSAGMVRDSTSSYSFPIVMVRKADGAWRKCVDYRDLNKVTVDMKFPLQNYRAILDRMSGKKVFATLDLRQGFLQVPLHPDAIALTAFATPDGLYEYLRMPFGLKNAPNYFQKVMTDVLSDLIGVACEVFIDDIIVYGVDHDSFLISLEKVFDRLRARQLRLKESKCQFGLSQVEYVGHVVNGDGVTLSHARRQAIANIVAPRSTAEVRSFIGFANYFRQFVPGFAVLAKPLTALCSPKVAFGWGKEQEEAFQAIKEAAMRSPLLAFIDYSRPLVLRTDASTLGIGGVLLQLNEHHGKEVPIAFVSKAFNDVERKWSTIEQEAFAIYYCVKQLAHYLHGHKFVIETDHRNLTYMYRSTTPKVVRWRLALLDHDYEVRHLPGKENVVADALSRVLTLGDESVREEQTAARPTDAVEESTRGVISKYHNSLVGHRGVNRTIEMLRESGSVWDTMADDVKQYIAGCAVCQKIRLGQGSVAASLHTTTVDEPFSVIAIDTIGPLQSDGEGNRYILCAIDCFSRFVELKAARDVTAKSAARFLLELFGRYGAPKELRSDQGTQFTASVIRQLLQLCEVKGRYTLAYRPQANGMVERANGEVMRHLRSIVFDLRTTQNWSEGLPLVQRVVNATPHSALGTTPARVMFADAVDMHRGVLTQHVARGEQTVEDYVQQLSVMQTAVLQASARHQDEVVARYLKKSPKLPTSFREGDYVLVSYPERPPTKLHPRWRGPFAVVEVRGNTYLCQDLRTMKQMSFDVSRLKLYQQDPDRKPLDVAATEEQEYEVGQIVDHRGSPRSKSKMTFRVRWAGYQPEEDTWEPYTRVRDLEALDVYLGTHPELRL